WFGVPHPPGYNRWPMEKTGGGIHARFVVALAEAALRSGYPARSLYAQIGLSEDTAREADHQVDLDAYLELWATVMRALRQPSFPMTYARGFRLELFGVVGYAALTASDGWEAAQRMARFQRLSTDVGRMVLEERGDLAVFRWFRDRPLTLGHRAANEAVMAEGVELVRRMGGDGVSAVEVTFRHPAPSEVAGHARFFGVAPRFSAPEDSMSFPRSLFRRPMPMAHGDFSAFFTREAERSLKAVGEPTLVARVEHSVLAALPSGAPAMPAIAAQLDMSERQLRRELESAGVRFRGILERLRRERAAQLLGETGSTVDQTALVLGFSDVSAFSRAFKRWYAVPPTAYRARHFRASGRG
ncbi:MAG TPA: AraC family transcriptional regulator, partial [Myxococcaceae bacterium]|nr:AraC family transcriptional regulator [Myxococcaceae bacterium]